MPTRVLAGERCDSTLPAPTCSRGSWQMGRRLISSSAPTRRRWRSPLAPERLTPRRINLLGNRLAVIVRRDPSTTSIIRRLEDLLRPEVKRLAVGDPAAVPAGVYARRWLEAA